MGTSLGTVTFTVQPMLDKSAMRTADQVIASWIAKAEKNSPKLKITVDDKALDKASQKISKAADQIATVIFKADFSAIDRKLAELQNKLKNGFTVKINAETGNSNGGGGGGGKVKPPSNPNAIVPFNNYLSTPNVQRVRATRVNIPNGAGYGGPGGGNAGGGGNYAANGPGAAMGGNAAGAGTQDNVDGGGAAGGGNGGGNGGGGGGGGGGGWFRPFLNRAAQRMGLPRGAVNSLLKAGPFAPAIGMAYLGASAYEQFRADKEQVGLARQYGTLDDYTGSVTNLVNNRAENDPLITAGRILTGGLVTRREIGSKLGSYNPYNSVDQWSGIQQGFRQDMVKYDALNAVGSASLSSESARGGLGGQQAAESLRHFNASNTTTAAFDDALNKYGGDLNAPGAQEVVKRFGQVRTAQTAETQQRQRVIRMNYDVSALQNGQNRDVTYANALGNKASAISSFFESQKPIVAAQANYQFAGDKDAINAANQQVNYQQLGEYRNLYTSRMVESAGVGVGIAQANLAANYQTYTAEVC